MADDKLPTAPQDPPGDTSGADTLTEATRAGMNGLRAGNSDEGFLRQAESTAAALLAAEELDAEVTALLEELDPLVERYVPDSRRPTNRVHQVLQAQLRLARALRSV